MSIYLGYIYIYKAEETQLLSLSLESIMQQ